MSRYFTLSALSLAACLSGTAALADTPASFKASVTCDTLEGYDPDYASHGDNYGQYLGKAATVNGFYQLAERGGKLYAAFSGARESAGAATPGMLVVLDADTLRHERSIALPFQAHALTLSPAGDAQARYAIATHTFANAFSIVDLATGTVRCLKPDTSFGDVKEYRGRYVTADEEGNFYISYHSRKFPAPDEAASSVVMKYDANGKHAADFAVNVVEEGMALPLFYRDGELLVGGKGPKTVSARTGEVTALATPQDDLNIFGYVPGPGGTLLAGSRSTPWLGPNLVLYDVGANSHSAIYTGFTTIGVAYVEEAAQVFATNLEARTLTVAALPGDARGFTPGRFVNIAFEGMPDNLLAWRVADGTAVFVSAKHFEEDKNHKAGQLHKVKIDGAVRGIDGIDKPGACTVTTFDLADKSVSDPVACTILDAKASYRNDALVAQFYLDLNLKNQKEISSQLAEAKAELEKAQQSGADAGALAEVGQKIASLQREDDQSKKRIRASQAAVELLERLGKSD